MKLWLFWKCFPKNSLKLISLTVDQGSRNPSKLDWNCFQIFPWRLRSVGFWSWEERKIRIWFSILDLCCVSIAEHRMKSYRLNWKSSNAETRVKRKPTKQFPALCCWCWHSRSATPVNRQGCARLWTTCCLVDFHHTIKLNKYPRGNCEKTQNSPSTQKKEWKWISPVVPVFLFFVSFTHHYRRLRSTLKHTIVDVRSLSDTIFHYDFLSRLLSLC